MHPLPNNGGYVIRLLVALSTLWAGGGMLNISNVSVGMVAIGYKLPSLVGVVA
jgi:hypothetical protein